jgi:acyl phosphate:glycerol-3-phosphate acyltransferase
MQPAVQLGILLLIAYLLGTISFGLIVARAKGVNLLASGSKNIGATNVGRTLGRKWGILVFVLDLLKGVLAVGLARYLVNTQPDFASWQPVPELAAVGAGVCAFLGHTFPFYLNFRGGKGVATGFGAMLILLPVPALVAIVVWLSVVAICRYVSLASVLAMLAFMVSYTVLHPLHELFTTYLMPSLFTYMGCSMVVLKHHGNLRRLRAGTENRMDDRPTLSQLSNSIHALSLGWLFGASLFLQFIAGLSVFATFPEVIANAPSDRTANVAISAGLNDVHKKDLASALAGAAIGPMFPPYFRLSALAATLALIGGWHSPRWRFRMLLVLWFFVVGNALIAGEVSQLRLERFSDVAEIATQAKANFGRWHLISLALSMLTCVLATVGLATVQQRIQRD